MATKPKAGKALTAVRKTYGDTLKSARTTAANFKDPAAGKAYIERVKVSSGYATKRDAAVAKDTAPARAKAAAAAAKTAAAAAAMRARAEADAAPGPGQIEDSPVSEQSRTVEDINAHRASQNLGRVGDSKTAPQPASTGGQRRQPGKATPATPATPGTPATPATPATHKPRNPALAWRGSAQAQRRRAPAKAGHRGPTMTAGQGMNEATGQPTPNVSHVHPGRKYHMPSHDSFMGSTTGARHPRKRPATTPAATTPTT